jgi:hypothetical protein
MAVPVVSATTGAAAGASVDAALLAADAAVPATLLTTGVTAFSAAVTGLDNVVPPVEITGAAAAVTAPVAAFTTDGMVVPVTGVAVTPSTADVRLPSAPVSAVGDVVAATVLAALCTAVLNGAGRMVATLVSVDGTIPPVPPSPVTAVKPPVEGAVAVRPPVPVDVEVLPVAVVVVAGVEDVLDELLPEPGTPIPSAEPQPTKAMIM